MRTYLEEGVIHARTCPLSSVFALEAYRPLAVLPFPLFMELIPVLLPIIYRSLYRIRSPEIEEVLL